MHLNIKSNILPFFILLNLFGFPIIIAVNLYLGLSTSMGSIMYRSIILIIALLLIANAITFKKKPTLQVKLLVLFWILYSIRLFYDLSIRDLYLESEFYDSSDTIYLFAFGGILIPLLAIIMNAKFINFKVLGKLLLKASFIQCIFVLLGLYKLFGINLGQIAAQRHLYSSAQLGENLTGGSPLNPILVSRCGVLLILLAVSNYLFQRDKTHFLIKYFAIPLGLLLVILGGSRGPLVSMLLVLIFIYFIFLNKNKLKSKVILRQIIISISLLYVLFFVYQMFSEQIGLFDRFSQLNDNASIDLGRSEHWSAAINQFMDNPFLGDQIFDKHLWIYPHNLIIEAFMALGVVGGLLFLYLIISNLLKYSSIVKHQIKTLPILLLFMLYLMFGMSSGGLYNSTEFWIAITLASILDVNLKTKLKFN